MNDDPRAVVSALKSQPGRDIWLYGGGVLFRELLDAGLVDTVEVAVIPVLLGSGIPLLPPGSSSKLVLTDHRVLPATGIVVLAFAVPGGTGPAPQIRFIKSDGSGAAGTGGKRRRPAAKRSTKARKPRASRSRKPAGGRVVRSREPKKASKRGRRW